ncbi:hypothetical protein NQP46_17485 [Streptomyces albus]|nr:hypothetical protein NQP46_17485 [Streptomyces albus]
MEQGQRWWGPVGRGTEPPPSLPSPPPPRTRGNGLPKAPGPRPPHRPPPRAPRTPAPCAASCSWAPPPGPRFGRRPADPRPLGSRPRPPRRLRRHLRRRRVPAGPGSDRRHPGPDRRHPGTPRPAPTPVPAHHRAPPPAAAPHPAHLPTHAPASLPAPRPAHDPAVTTFGLLLQAHPFVPAPGSPYQELAAWSRALEAYDEAGRAGAEQVPGILAEGRAALTTLDRLLGLDAPASDCFFDPRHGPAAATVRWAPPHGAARTVEVCRADATRLADAEAATGPAHAPPAYDTCHGNGALRLTLRTPGDAAPLLLVFTCDTPRTAEVIA